MACCSAPSASLLSSNPNILFSPKLSSPPLSSLSILNASNSLSKLTTSLPLSRSLNRSSPRRSFVARASRSKVKPLSASLSVPQPLDLTEDNVKQALVDARGELGQIFDTSVGMTGVVELVELDGPYVTISLKGRFWHKRSTVLARLANYLKQRIPEILEVEIENEQQLDDSPANF